MQLELVLRLIASGVLGAMIGWERRSRDKEAGLRTHFVVCVGSALIMIVSKYGFRDMETAASTVLDPSRIAAQVVSGIGFLGAGTILVQRQSIRGLTTAAGLWATSGIGLAIGAGMYLVGAVTTALVLIALEVLSREGRISVASQCRLVIEARDLNAVMETLDADCPEARKVQIRRVTTSADKPLVTVVLQVRMKPGSNLNDLISKVQASPDVFSITLD
ncbi:MgtC/SapB family protein [Alicyclobacillus fastidiosus]|uniref:MgtC/SapB family protein n=2 Tax=Alicyclobacillus fastidiosus TaxID=392011 RepID=A0ABV5AEW6_9BACL|nr:MgtC/SapB family protein [Alicyclobacillus fastidiosus]WEH09465.1 MgtC/SapB family protein [Alicyclobacillus fastidiosus]